MLERPTLQTRSLPRRVRLRVGHCLALVAIVTPGPAVVRAATYHVDRANAACANSGPGSEARPYCAISAAVRARGGPGTTILVHPGVYAEQVGVDASGTSGDPLVIRATGSGVVIDGADDFSDPAMWIRHAGDVWLAASVTWNPAQVFAGDARLAPSTAAPASLPAGSFAWAEGAGLYVNAGGAHPGDKGIRVGRRNYGFSLYEKSWVTIEGFAVTRLEDRGIHVAGSCSNVSVLRNTVTLANKYGIQVAGGSGIVIGSNTVSDNNDHGIGLTGGATGCVVEDNESFRNARPNVRAANGIYLFGSPRNVLRRNRTHGNQDSGVNIQTGSNDCVSYLNLSWSNGDHGYDHLEATGTIHVCDVAYGNHRDGFSVEGNSTGTRIYNSISMDNGLMTGHFDLWVEAGSTAGFLSDCNLFWSSAKKNSIKYIDTKYSTLAKYGAASGQDVRSLQADPRFVDPAAGDFRLRPGSPAIDNADSGVPHWPALDALGNTRHDDPATPNAGAGPVTHSDRGALEYVPDPASPPKAPTGAREAEGGPFTFRAAGPARR